MNNPDLIVIFIKAPRLGEVKTRLAQKIGVEKAQMIYRAMVEDLMQNFKGPHKFDIHIAVWPQDAEPEVRHWLDWKEPIEIQAEGDLGTKLKRAFEDAFAQGYERVVIIGSDLPDLSDSMIKDSFKQLSKYPLVLGPAMDGGYYLIGLSSLYTELFNNIDWSTSRVLHGTLKRADKAGIRYFILPEMRDIDEYDDILALWNELRNGKEKHLSKTKLILQKMFTN